ncbi:MULTISPECIES: cytochrome aa3 quinol oxidase subunit II [Gracilibacillus]|uniref:Quinol oxidase subunit 2 n=1 Tax=Gracilibacillus dipsosauri TaxID=178340 RepID=A0A317KUH5_9BACI|nr:cytochrome aa3 quinol oxidase subunit II [Gracilibacillus dipsosauri]PWU66794.1 cytochrome aa3 quinol oxidase subunit II [Gracilibacillus dipsosauri]
MKALKKVYGLFLLLVTPLILAGCENKLIVFDPKGPVARNLSDLIIFSIIFMLIIVAVVFILFTVIVWKYRARPNDGDFEPKEEKGNHILEIIWFGIPVLIVIALMIPTTKTIYEVEDIPQGYEEEEPLVIHVTSADWKWIFSYPDQNIETVNYINIPKDHPVQFKLTSAGTMQSFWVPELGGQKYTMANMQTNLYLVADQEGSFYGRNTNFNGRGYAHMDFEVQAQSKEDFNEWIHDVKKTANKLTEDQYDELLEPGVVGRMTFNNTHLDWIDHAKGGSADYIHPELYEIQHGEEKEQELDGQPEIESKHQSENDQSEQHSDSSHMEDHSNH